MKKFILLLPALLFAGSNWNYNTLIEEGDKIDIICKNGYLTERVTFKDTKSVIEETYCYNKSMFGNCKHAPVQCKEEKK